MQASNVTGFPVEDLSKVPLTHHSIILNGIKAILGRYYYVHRTAEKHLIARELRQLVRGNAYKSQGYMPDNFVRIINNPIEARRAVEMFRDEYLPGFVNVEEIGQRESIDVDKRVVEQKTVRNIKNFIMTLGRDFALIGNQYYLEIYGVEQLPDLLLFNRELDAMVAVELKLGKPKTSYLRQLFGYLQILNDHVRKPHENPSIGIVPCQTADHSHTQYIVRDYARSMGVATYKTLDDVPGRLRKALPDVNKMIEILKKKG